MEFGKIFSDSWKEYKTNFKLYAKLIFYFIFLPSLLYLILNQLYLVSINYDIFTITEIEGISVPIIKLSYLLTTMGISITIALIGIIATLGIYASVLHNKKNFKKALKKGNQYYLKYILFMIVIGIFIFGLALLFIIPALIFGIFWAFAIYILIKEDKGIIESLKTSFNLVKGRWWLTFGYSVLFILITIGIGIIFSIPAMPTSIMVSMDSSANPTLYQYDSIPTTLAIVHTYISEIFSMLSQFIILPLTILFYKNFYLEMKKKRK